MARQSTPGISYYSSDVDMVHNRKIKLLFNEFDSHGYWIYSCLLSEIYRVKGYYLDISDKDYLTLFALDVCKKPVSLVSQVIDGCIRRSLFDKRVFDMFKVLTSDRIQENYLEATAERRRKGCEITLMGEFCLFDIDVPRNNLKITRKNGVNTRNYTQSKVKESKVKESKGKESKVEREVKTSAPAPQFLKKIFDTINNKRKFPELFPKEYAIFKRDLDKLVQDFQKREDELRVLNKVAEIEKIKNVFEKRDAEFKERREKIVRDEIMKFKKYYAPRHWKLPGGFLITEESCMDVFSTWCERNQQFKKK